jgi:hypothetical protein
MPFGRVQEDKSNRRNNGRNVIYMDFGPDNNFSLLMTFCQSPLLSFRHSSTLVWAGADALVAADQSSRCNSSFSSGWHHVSVASLVRCFAAAFAFSAADSGLVDRHFRVSLAFPQTSAQYCIRPNPRRALCTKARDGRIIDQGNHIEKRLVDLTNWQRIWGPCARTSLALTYSSAPLSRLLLMLLSPLQLPK